MIPTMMLPAAPKPLPFRDDPREPAREGADQQERDEVPERH